jgi:hypothetical protein
MSNPPKNINETATARRTVKITGRVGWIFPNPTMGTYQKKKATSERIRQVSTSNPMNIRF